MKQISKSCSEGCKFGIEVPQGYHYHHNNHYHCAGKPPIIETQVKQSQKSKFPERNPVLAMEREALESVALLQKVFELADTCQQRYSNSSEKKSTDFHASIVFKIYQFLFGWPEVKLTTFFGWPEVQTDSTGKRPTFSSTGPHNGHNGPNIS